MRNGKNTDTHIWTVVFYANKLRICPRWSVFSMKHGNFFAEKTRTLLVFSKKNGFSVIDTKHGSTLTIYGFFSVKHGSPHLDINLLGKLRIRIGHRKSCFLEDCGFCYFVHYSFKIDSSTLATNSWNNTNSFCFECILQL